MKKTQLLTLLFSCLSWQLLACSSEEYRQFDFWIGEWQVTNPANNQVSISKISLINNNCSILEEYQTPSGYQGKSLNIYNQQTKQWHQTWVDNTGLLLQLNGEFKQGVMTLSGLTVDNKGQEVLNKISWKKLSDGRVNQVWQTSTDKGKHWQTLFDGYYQKIQP
ncbi:hypothetical protein HII17_04060 [Thalassotalea sp. M1531]|uniref:DUF1579 domain-containing protein n=1 Tax=Thalassotalea algicola TaxID=2716224 RepID=A0A7Y0LCS5_9GAMM|nr:hypothetical protein [Thalassotalea algicola]NMP30730.1 hypothetical protein [Thalassotalea algicola]